MSCKNSSSTTPGSSSSPLSESSDSCLEISLASFMDDLFISVRGEGVRLSGLDLRKNVSVNQKGSTYSTTLRFNFVSIFGDLPSPPLFLPNVPSPPSPPPSLSSTT